MSSLPEDDKYYQVELHRGARGFGFSIRGGKEFNNMPLFVLKVAPNGAADLDGRLRVMNYIPVEILIMPGKYQDKKKSFVLLCKDSSFPGCTYGSFITFCTFVNCFHQSLRK